MQILKKEHSGRRNSHSRHIRQKNTWCVEGTARKPVCLEQSEGREGSQDMRSER